MPRTKTPREPSQHAVEAYDRAVTTYGQLSEEAARIATVVRGSRTGDAVRKAKQRVRYGR